MTARLSSTPGGARPIGAFASLLAGTTKPTRALSGTSPRSGQPVWRNSYYVGQIEDRIWKPINGGTTRGGKRWTRALLEAAKTFELKTRAERREAEPGARNGALGEVGIAVLEYLYRTVDYKTGRLDPALRTIAEDIGRAYSAVHEALKRLRHHGFLEWMRRSEPVDDPEPGGPLVKQASNAYALLCPPAMRSWIARIFGKAPPADCEVDRKARDRAEFDAMLAALTATEYLAAAGPTDALLGETLRNVAAAVDARVRQERESCRRDETGGL